MFYFIIKVFYNETPELVKHLFHWDKIIGIYFLIYLIKVSINLKCFMFKVETSIKVLLFYQQPWFLCFFFRFALNFAFNLPLLHKLDTLYIYNIYVYIIKKVCKVSTFFLHSQFARKHQRKIAREIKQTQQKNQFEHLSCLFCMSSDLNITMHKDNKNIRIRCW